MTKLTWLLLSLAAVSQVHAAEINLGMRNPDGSESPALSIRTGQGPAANQTQIRYAVIGREVVCSHYRPDLCDKTVKRIDVTLQDGACILATDILIHCQLDQLLGEVTVTALLADGTVSPLNEIAGHVSVATVTAIRWNGKALVAETAGQLDIQIWGNRADGLDPLIQTTGPSLFGGPRSIQPVSVSLFSK